MAGVTRRMHPAAPFRPLQLRASTSCLTLALLLLGLTACESERPHQPPPEAMSAAEDSARAALPRMEARNLFFDGRIEVEILLARAGTRWARSDDAGGGTSDRSGLGSGGFGGGRGGTHGGGHRGGGRSRSYEADRASDDQPQGAVHASTQPPVELRLRLTNHGSAPVDVEVADFNSDLGNFVVQPSKITLPPGKAIEADPMVSRLGVAAEEIPLTVKLHANGRAEQQVLRLRIVKEPAAESSPPATFPPQ